MEMVEQLVTVAGTGKEGASESYVQPLVETEMVNIKVSCWVLKRNYEICLKRISMKFGAV